MKHLFHHNVRNSHWGALLEASTDGETLASGYVDSLDPENMMFYSESVINSSGSKNFLLLDLPAKFQTAGISRTRLSKEERRKRNFELEAIVREDPGALDLISLEYRELNMGIRESIDKELCNLLCNSQLYWETNSLLYHSYYESEFIENFRVRLLFFQVGAFELKTDTGDIWSLLTNFSRKRFSNDV